MVNLIKNQTPAIGIWIVEDLPVGELVTDNTPGNIDLDQMALGTNYIHIETAIRIEHVVSTTTKSDDFKGHVLSNTGVGKTGHWTGQADSGNFIIVGEVDNATAALIKKFVKLNNRTNSPQKYILNQYASETFEEFPNDVGTLRKYCPILTSGVSVVELEGQKDRKQVSLGAWETWP